MQCVAGVRLPADLISASNLVVPTVTSTALRSLLPALRVATGIAAALAAGRESVPLLPAP